MAIAWPSTIIPRNVLFRLENASRSGGVSLSGAEQIVGSLVGRWRATIAEIPLVTAEKILAYRAFLAEMEGRTNTVLVPAFDAIRAPWPVDAYGNQLTPSATRTQSLDGTEYEDLAIPAESAIVAVASADAAQRATSLAINVTQGAPLKAGNYFGLGGNRLYLIKSIAGTSGSVQTVNLWPPLRAAVSMWSAVELRTPVCEMRLASDSSGEMMLAMGRWSTPTLEFVEVL